MEAGRIAEVIARAQGGDPAAFDDLIASYGSRLYGYFYRLTGVRQDAEDLLQEVFVRLVRMIREYEHDGRFEAWLFRIATNLVRDRVRRAHRVRMVRAESDSAEGEHDFLARRSDPAAEGPAEAVQRAEQVDRLQRALRELNEAEREVILLRHFSRMGFREIAELMDTPIGTALARAHRGLAKLRQLMEDG